MGDVLKLQTNVPETISLAFADGLPVESKFGGDQIMFTLNDGRKWFAAPFVAQKIAAAGVVAHQPFSICKREITENNRRRVEYQIDTAAAVPAAAAVVVSSGAGAVATPPARASKMTEVVTPSSHFPTSPSTPAAANGNGHAAAPAAGDSSAAAIRFAGMAAIDAVLAVEAYAQSKGMTDFSFGAENIQKVWLTLYIDARKGGRA